MWRIMDATFLVVLLVAMCTHTTTGFSTANFAETGECQGEQVCLYHYAVEQQYFAGEGQQNSSITSEVEIVCNSVGTYNGNDAILYCMTLRNASLEGSMFEDIDGEQTRNREQFLDHLLSGLFCFVQTADGKIAAVYHPTTERVEAVNFKRAIAAAFQANFKGTDIEEEIDPQSTHKSHYKIETSLNDGTVKMHRTVNGDDVVEYSTGTPRRDIKLNREEDVEYQSGKLRHSAGNTSVKLSKNRDEEERQGFSDLFSAKGSYSLDLVQCFSIASRAYSRHRRSVGDEMEENGKEESLKATFNQTSFDLRQIEQLREEIPSVMDALQQLSQDRENRKIFGQLQLLLELEFKHGSLSGYIPALTEVLDYLSMIQHSPDPHDETMRLVLYSLLAAEGSIEAQMVLTEALEMNIVSEDERIALINEIAMVKEPHMNFVRQIKDYLISISGDMDKAEPLLLSFGALASEATPEVEEFVVSFLLELEVSANFNGELEEGTSSAIPLIVAMGNTGSKLVVSSLLEYINSPDKTVQLMAIQALQKLMYEERVLDRLEQLLVSEEIDEDILVTVTEALVTGLEYSTSIDNDTNLISQHPILETLVEVTLEFNNTNIRSLVQSFLKDVGGEQAYELLDQFHSLSRRGTDWDEDSSIYDLVAAYTVRQSDASVYPTHKSYLWGKRFGIREANLVVAAGVFGGISDDCDNLKGFGRAIAKANILYDYTATIGEVKVVFKKTGADLRGQVYVKLGKITLVNFDHTYTAAQCFTYARPLFEQRRSVLQLRYPVPIYVGTIDLMVSVNGFVSASFDARMCGSASVYELATATAGLVPRIGVSVEGSASANLLGLARGGVSAEASFIYQLEPRASAKACGISCSLDYQTCVGVYESWPGNTLSIYAWYQTRDVEWCTGWAGFRYPCGTSWGSRQRWDDFSWSWSLGSRERSALYESCDGTENPQCSATEN